MAVPARYKKKWLSDQIMSALMQYQDDVEEVYGQTSPVPKIEKEVMDWRFNWFQSRDLRISVMGNPIWYCEVLFSGPTISTKETVDRRWVGGMHEFAIALFLEYKEGESTDLFEDMTDEISSNRKGLMLYLRDQGIQRITFPDPNDDDDNAMTKGDVLMSIRETGDEEVYLDQRTIANFEKDEFGDSDKAHLLTFRVNIVDIL